MQGGGRTGFGARCGKAGQRTEGRARGGARHKAAQDWRRAEHVAGSGCQGQHLLITFSCFSIHRIPKNTYSAQYEQVKLLGGGLQAASAGGPPDCDAHRTQTLLSKSWLGNTRVLRKAPVHNPAFRNACRSQYEQGSCRLLLCHRLL